jgi:hypothetical protein
MKSANGRIFFLRLSPMAPQLSGGAADAAEILLVSFSAH